MLEHSIGNKELGVFRPAVELLSQFDFVLAEWFAVGRAAVLLMRRAVADVAVHDDECGPVAGISKLIEGAGQRVEVVGIAYVSYVPAVASEACGDVFTE